MAQRPRVLDVLIVLPWIASAVVLLTLTRIKGPRVHWHWGLLGSGAICFSIGCLARTSVVLGERAAKAAESPPEQSR